MSTTGANPRPSIGPSVLHLDLPRGIAQPRAWRWVLATMLAVAASLLACFGLAHMAELLDPALVGYGHFQFTDYSRLTIVGVLIACAGWPVVTWFTTAGRRLYLWLALLVTVVSLAPDVWIFHLGQPVGGVVTLGAMHLALAVITFLAMVFISPQRTIANAESQGTAAS